MTALALHLPGRRGITRWMLAAVAIVIAHAIVIGALALWYTRTPPEEKLIPAIVVSIVPAAPLSPMENDPSVATEETTHIDPTPPEPPKVETKVEPPPEEIKPPPPQPAEIALPKPEPKPVEKKPVEKKRVEKLPPPQEAHERAATREASRQSSVAASNNYNSLVYRTARTHSRAIRHRRMARPETRRSAFRSAVSGNASARVHVRNHQAMSTLDAGGARHRAPRSPFPPFPPGMTGAQDICSPCR